MTSSEVRKYYDETNQKWYFSVVDVVALTNSSKNPQNYWKVLKNRLKKEQNELVTKCNRLKMKARDGKSYLTDAADQETLTELIKLIPGARVNDLAACFEPFVVNPPLLSKEGLRGGEPEKLPPRPSDTPPSQGGEDTAAELLLDAYQTDDAIFIAAFVAGVSLADLNIEVSSRKIIIEGKRAKPPADYFTQELLWLSFSRELELPFPVDADRAQASESQGQLTIRLPKAEVPKM